MVLDCTDPKLLSPLPLLWHPRASRLRPHRLAMSQVWGLRLGSTRKIKVIKFPNIYILFFSCCFFLLFFSVHHFVLFSFFLEGWIYQCTQRLLSCGEIEGEDLCLYHQVCSMQPQPLAQFCAPNKR